MGGLLQRMEQPICIYLILCPTGTALLMFFFVPLDEVTHLPMRVEFLPSISLATPTRMSSQPIGHQLLLSRQTFLLSFSLGIQENNRTANPCLSRHSVLEMTLLSSTNYLCQCVPSGWQKRMQSESLFMANLQLGLS